MRKKRVIEQVLDFNHVSPDLSEQDKKTLEEYYTAYHKKWWSFQKLKPEPEKFAFVARKLKRWKFRMDLEPGRKIPFLHCHGKMKTNRMRKGIERLKDGLKQDALFRIVLFLKVALKDNLGLWINHLAQLICILLTFPWPSRFEGRKRKKMTKQEWSRKKPTNIKKEKTKFEKSWEMFKKSESENK